MSLLKHCTFVFLVVFCNLLFAQDTVKYCQSDAVLYSNCYTFIYADKSDKQGTFSEVAYTDDGGRTIGQGTFYITPTSIKLHFEPLKCEQKVVFFAFDTTGSSDSVLFRMFDCIGRERNDLLLSYADTLQFGKIMDWNDQSLVILATKDLKSKNFSIYSYSYEDHLLDFQLPEAAVDVWIFAEKDGWRTSFFEKKNETLLKIKNGFITEGIYNGDKRVKFIKRGNHP